MKLIIDIDEGDYKWIKDHVMTVNEQRIANGIPLDKIRAEIEQYNLRPSHYPCDMISIGVVLQIIDKYIAESEG